jgi:hypothetical protein
MPRTTKGPASRQVDLQGVYLTRYENLLKLKDTHGGPTAVALKLGYTNGSMVSQMAGPHPSRMIGEKLARTIEQKLGYAEGYLDKPHGPGRPRKAAEQPPPAADQLELRGQCVGLVMGLARALRIELSETKRNEIVSMTIEEAQRVGQVDPAYVERLLKIAS